MMRSSFQKWMQVVLALSAVIALTFSGFSQASAQSFNPNDPQQVVSNGEVQWKLELSLAAPRNEIEDLGGVDAASSNLTGMIQQKLAEQNIQQTLVDVQVGETEVVYQVALQGATSLDALRSLLFESLGNDFDFLYGPAGITIHANVSKDQIIPLILEARPTTGYVWSLSEESKSAFEETQPVEFANVAGQIGGSVRQSLYLKALVEGEVTIQVIYRQPWQADAAAVRNLDVTVGAVSGEINLSSPVQLAVSSAFESLDTSSMLANPGLSVNAVEAAALPTVFDWRAQGKVTPIRNQGGCGSCWAFGTVGAMESALLIKTGQSVDLSEQYLVSCNVSNWSCSGGWWAHDLHTNVAGKSSNPAGAVLESAKPYTATNGTCTQVYDHPYKLADWQYITGTWTITPTVEQLKAAIYNYGPVSASVCVAGGFGSYTSGVFSENNTCGGSPNHGIVLVGWDDSTQSWILRNSWGTSWGDKGYMKIKYGVSLVGYGATYVVYNSPVNAPLPAVSSLDPASVKAGTAGFTLTITGTNFVTGSVVRWNGSNLPTTYVSNTKVTAVVSEALIAAAGQASITVFNPAPGGGLSNAVSYSIYNSAPPKPTNYRQIGATPTSITVGWDDVRTETGYRIYKWGVSNSVWDFYPYATLAADSTRYTENLSSCGTNGYYKVTAFNAYGESDTTFHVNAFTNSCNMIAGDDFDTAIKVSYGSGPVAFSQQVDASLASKAWDDPLLAGAQREKTFWYAFTPISSGTLKVDTYTSTFDTILGVWTGSRGSLKLAGSNNNTNGLQSFVQISAAAGTTYYIEAASATSSAATLNFHLNFTPALVGNNSFTTPVIIQDLPAGVEYTKVQDVYRATIASDDPSFPEEVGKKYRTVWYRYRPSVSGLLTLDTSGSDYDTVVGVWRGAAGSLNSMSWNDNADNQTISRLQVQLVGMTTYYIEVANMNAVGPSKLNFQLTFTPGTPVSSGVYDNTSSEIIYNGSWIEVGFDAATAGGLHTSAKKYNTAGLTFYGQRVALEYSRMSGAGALRVVIDGVTRASINQGGTASNHRMWTSGLLSGPGPHTLMVYHLSGGPVNLDSVRIQTAPAVLGAGTYDNLDSNFDLRGYWYTSEAPQAEQGSLSLSPVVGDRITVKFNGSGVRLNYAKLPSAGVVKVTIDGVVVAYLNQLSSTAVYGKTWTRTLTNKEHVMTLTHYSGGAVNLDAVTVLVP